MIRIQALAAIALAATIGLATPISGFAQSANEMTAEEISNAFKKQKTRGLVIVPSGQQATGTDSGTETASVAPATTPAYSAVDREDQVNIQISFDFDSAALREDQKVKLTALCDAMNSVDVSVFQIIGHTDSSGKASYNQRLSLLRAQEVKHYLVSGCGIAEDRLEAVGMGETAPFNSDDPRSDENRRVEFQALG